MLFRSGGLPVSFSWGYAVKKEPEESLVTIISAAEDMNILSLGITSKMPMPTFNHLALLLKHRPRVQIARHYF